VTSWFLILETMGLQIVDTLLGELVNGITQKPKRKRR
jgi:hypothetical protein